MEEHKWEKLCKFSSHFIKLEFKVRYFLKPLLVESKGTLSVRLFAFNVRITMINDLLGEFLDNRVCQLKMSRPETENKWHYYSFKIFLCFGLAEMAWTSHHNQLLSTRPNLEEFCDTWKMTSIVQHNCQKNDQLIEKTWFDCVSRGRNRRTRVYWLKHSKNSKKTIPRLLFGEY